MICSASSSLLRSGAKAAFVAHTRGQLALHQHLLERVEHLRAHAQRLGKIPGAHGQDHELLKVHRVGGVRTAVEMFIIGTGNVRAIGPPR
jgi:hypothetical protein